MLCRLDILPSRRLFFRTAGSKAANGVFIGALQKDLCLIDRHLLRDAQGVQADTSFGVCKPEP